MLVWISRILTFTVLFSVLSFALSRTGRNILITSPSFALCFFRRRSLLVSWDIALSATGSLYPLLFTAATSVFTFATIVVRCSEATFTWIVTVSLYVPCCFHLVSAYKSHLLIFSSSASQESVHHPVFPVLLPDPV